MSENIQITCVVTKLLGIVVLLQLGIANVQNRIHVVLILT